MPSMRRLARFIAGTIVAIATIGVLVGVVVLVLLSPLWVFGEQDRVGSASLTGYTPAEVRIATGAILGDLVVGPPDFDVTIRDQPVLNETERGHMRDVRTTFLALFAVVGVSVIVLIIARWRSHGSILFWRGVRSGSAILAVSVAALAGFALVAFGLLFQLLHALLFPPGTFTFDSRTDRLVQLFPEQFWFETAIVLAIGLIIVGLLVRSRAGRRLAALRADAVASDHGKAATPVTTPPAGPVPPADAPPADAPPVDAAPAGT